MEQNYSHPCALLFVLAICIVSCLITATVFILVWIDFSREQSIYVNGESDDINVCIIIGWYGE